MMSQDFAGWGYGSRSRNASVAKSDFDNSSRDGQVNTATSKPRSLSIINRLKWLFYDHEDGDLEDWDPNRHRHTPGSLDALCDSTKFTRREIQSIYNGFKQDCPNGTVSKEKFKELYSQFYPLGGEKKHAENEPADCIHQTAHHANNNNIFEDARTYSGHVFDTLDKNPDGNVTFEHFLVAMSVISRGSFDEKLRWIFNLYDLNGDGYVTPEELTELVSSIYDMLGKRAYPPVNEDTAQEHAERIFQKMDLNKDGMLTFDEFHQVCKNDFEIRRSMDLFDTVLL